MSNITLKEVKSKNELKDFVKFPFKLYKDSEYWVPPIIADEMATLSSDKNPVFDHAKARYFLAYKNKTIVGRVAAIINKSETEDQGLKKMRFGWFDTIDDIEVTKTLLDKVEEIGRENNLEFTEGPVGFSNLDKVGALTEGFNQIGTMVTWYNHPYYAKHFEQLGFTPEKEYVESRFYMSQLGDLRFMKAYNLIMKRYGFKTGNFTTTKELIPYLDTMFELFNNSYKDLSTFVPISNKQRDYFKKKFINFVNPEYIKFVFDKDDNMIAFAIVLPSFSKALQKVNGKLFPFGFLKLLKAKKESKTLLFYLIGVDPKFQNKGVTAVIFYEFNKTFKKHNIETCIRTPELVNNTASQQIWKEFNAEVIKRRKTFKKML
ncbi:GTP cyclohydrolase [Mangrovimonas spongiae]|uniref:GTP cyclohydrolase n=1 Tax=Mangrovimonas spongiae TaxID=2494697 RepID=A0A3R9N4E6_9FLAO|nr:GTP cyclohydrolase [Mangrovimonas spongiae]RSK38753.1 GTP cyclohydrolase [Mangrovimonas spongiae]